MTNQRFFVISFPDIKKLLLLDKKFIEDVFVDLVQLGEVFIALAQNQLRFFVEFYVLFDKVGIRRSFLNKYWVIITFYVFLGSFICRLVLYMLYFTCILISSSFCEACD